MAQMAILFREPEDVLAFLDGSRPITREVCMDICRAQWLFSEIQLGFFESRVDAAKEYEKKFCPTCGNRLPCHIHRKQHTGTNVSSKKRHSGGNEGVGRVV